MGEDGAQEDGGQEEEGDVAPLVDLVEDGVGALALGPEELVEPHDHQARQGQAIEQPGPGGPELRHGLHGDVEEGPQGAAGDAGDAGQEEPLGHGAAIEEGLAAVGPEELLDGVEHGGLLSGSRRGVKNVLRRMVLG